ncbi:MAG: M24 family metallopeptidase [Ignavibacteriales bacterium]|nr:M24 family metallopeptidase [Ignavibacteriales bacterium]
MSDIDKKIQSIQQALKEEKIPGWLLYNFRGSNVFATNILELPPHVMQTRRYFYSIPAEGSPKKLVHVIEQFNLDSLPGEKTIYLSYQSLEEGLKKILGDMKQVAMEYSPRNAIPYVSKVDGGTLEMVRGLGVDVVSSANLVQRFEACWNEEQTKDNFEAAKHLREIAQAAFGFIKNRITSNTPVNEYDVQQFMKSEFARRGMMSEDDPNCSVNANSANSHYEPTKNVHSPLKKGDFVLIDLWAKKNKPHSVYADITDAARNYIKEKGYGEYFVHRTGHSIGEIIHGNGANMDNIETRDERKIIPQTSFSIEPGIYFPGKWGIRSEIDVYISKDKEVIVTGLPMQEEVVAILG